MEVDLESLDRSGVNLDQLQGFIKVFPDSKTEAEPGDFFLFIKDWRCQRIHEKV